MRVSVQASLRGVDGNNAGLSFNRQNDQDAESALKEARASLAAAEAREAEATAPAGLLTPRPHWEELPLPQLDVERDAEVGGSWGT